MTILSPIFSPILRPLLQPLTAVDNGTFAPPVPWVRPIATTLFYYGQLTTLLLTEPELHQLAYQPVAVGTPLRFTITNLHAGEYLWIAAPTQRDISSLNQVFLGVPSQTSQLPLWTKVEDILTLNTVEYDAYRRGPIDASSAGETIIYQVTFEVGS